MILTAKQEQGLNIALARYKAHEKYTVISGYAGTGKSTLVRFIIEALDVAEDKVCYACFTGKAAEVLRKKGNKNTMTLHKLLYDFHPRKGGGFYRKPKDYLEYDIIIVDEVSMAPKEMMDLLFHHRCYVICLGDPFQLPPINKDEDNHLLDHPHIFLDEVMRQAEDSEIIRLSMDIRALKPIKPWRGNDINIVQHSNYVDGMLTWADQVLVAKNITRIDLNNKIRAMYGRGPLPEVGDKLVCLRNYWDVVDSNEDALVNGTICYLTDDLYFDTQHFPSNLKLSKYSTEILRSSLITDEQSVYESISIDKEKLLTGEFSLDWRDSYTLGRVREKYGDLVPKEFAYGYALTCHKAQGSEWDKVLVVEEGFPFNKEEHARWMYTAVTRAAKKLTLVLKD